MEQLVRVTVKAGQKRDAVALLPGGRLAVTTREPAEDNRANKAVLELIAGYLGIPLKSLRIVSGHQTPRKTLRILGKAVPE